MDRFYGIDAKLCRAKKQIEWANAFVPTWTAREVPWALQPEIDEGKRRYIWIFRQVKPVPPVFPVVCDEIIYHLRSVLDHLACHLVEACGGQVTNSTAWPIERTEWDWKRKVERQQRRLQVWRKKGGGPLKGIPIGSPVWTFIEGAQPYRRGGETRSDLLFALNEAWNSNKHRILNQSLTMIHPDGDPLDQFDITPYVEPVERRWLFKPNRKVEDGTKIALFRFPQDTPLPTMRVKVDAAASAQIGAGDGKGPTVNFEELLKLVQSLVTDAKALP